MPVIPATQEAEAEELPEPRRWRLQGAEIAPLHSNLGNKSETLSQKNKKNKNLLMNQFPPRESQKPNSETPTHWAIEKTFISNRKSRGKLGYGPTQALLHTVGKGIPNYHILPEGKRV